MFLDSICLYLVYWLVNASHIVILLFIFIIIRYYGICVTLRSFYAIRNIRNWFTSTFILRKMFRNSSFKPSADFDIFLNAKNIAGIKLTLQNSTLIMRSLGILNAHNIHKRYYTFLASIKYFAVRNICFSVLYIFPVAKFTTCFKINYLAKICINEIQQKLFIIFMNFHCV